MKERLMEFIQYKEISNRKFLLKCGLSETYINTLTGNPSGDTIKKIGEAYPELNTDWLLYGEGEMLKAPTPMLSAADTRQGRLHTVYNYLVLKGLFRTQYEFAEILDINNTNLSSAMNGNEKYLSDSLFHKINATFPEVSLEWLLSGVGSMLTVDSSVVNSYTEFKNNINQRIVEVVNFLIFSKAVLNQQDLSQKLGYNASSFSQIINGHTPVSDRFINKIISFAPYINAKWLVTGDGAMFSELPETLCSYGALNKTDDETDVNVDLSVMPAEVVEEIRKEIMEEEAVPIVPPEIAAKAEADIRKYVNDNVGELELFDPRTLTVAVDVAERVHTTSMLPTFVPGDIVFIRFLKDKTKIIDGRTYYFDTRTRPTMIRIVKLLPDGNLRLIAQNPRFGDIITDFNDIINIAEIKGLYREQFADQFAEIEQVRRHKDKQVDSMMKQSRDLIEQNGQALQIIKDLINK